MNTSTTPLLLDAISVFDAVDGTTKRGHAVLVREGRIDWIGPSEQAPRPDGTRIIPGAGRTVLPGLMNCHVHLSADGDNPVSAAPGLESTVEWGVAQAIVNCGKALRAGVTSVRDCGSKDGLAIRVAQIVERGYVPGPRIWAAGRVITMTGGHGHFIGRQADGPWGVAAAVRAELHDGADFIKIMATGGVLTQGVTPLQTAFTEAELTAAVTEAHNAGKRITSHAIGGPGVKNALRSGLDSIEHACFFDDEAISLALERDTIIVPTLLAVDRLRTNRESLPTWMYEKVLMEAEASESGFRAMVEAGVKIAAGTDAGTPYNPHEDMAHELRLMVSLGMRPQQALISATATAAENFGARDRLGTIEDGKQADLLVVDGDPTQDIAAIGRVVAVVKDGEVVHEAQTTASKDGSA